MKRAITLLLAIFMVGVTLVMFAPTASAAEPQLPDKLKATDVKIPKAAVQAAIEKAHGAVIVMCPGAKAALAAYNACKQQCAERAEHTPLTPADLELCGSMTAAQCAEMLIARRAQACIHTFGAAGCADEYAKLQIENAECKRCAELKTQAAAAINDVRAKAAAVARTEAALANARLALAAAQARANALVNARNRMCAAAQR